MIKSVREIYKKNILGFLFGPSIKLLEAVFDLLIPLFMKAIIDLNQYEDPSLIPNSISSSLAKFIRLFGNIVKDNQNLNDALVGGLIIFTMAILGFVVTMFAQYFAAKTSVKVGSEIRIELYKKILSLSKKDKEGLGNSYLQSVLNNDLYQIERGVLIFNRLIVRAPFIIIGSVIFSFILDYRIGIAFASIIPLILVSLIFILRKSSHNYQRIQNDLDDISNKTSDTISGARVLRAFDATEYENNRFSKYNNEYEKESIRVQKNNAFINPIIFEITSLVTVLIIFFLAGALFNSSESVKVVLTSTLIAAMAYLAQILFATVQFANVLLDLTRASVSNKRVDKVFEINNSIVNKEDALTKDINIGEEILSFKDVDFTYDKNDEHYALKNISFSLNKGKSLGIIGGTGSGKSTIIHLIERFLDPSNGEILYKGISMKDYDLFSLRGDIGLVNQKSYLFNGTIKDNFLMANPSISKEDIDNALKKAEAYDFVYQMKDDINHKIKEGGTNLSGGQRQRLCIARALIKNPEILILDDSTSALDLLTDKKIRSTLKDIKETSRIIVSQRVASISECDEIIVIDEGHLVGKGTHEELLKTCPIYKEIYVSQTSEE